MPQISQSNVQTLILPKIHSHQDLDYVADAVAVFCPSRGVSQGPNLQIIPSIESARGLWNLGSIAGWKSSHNPQMVGELSAILVRFLYPFYEEGTYMRAWSSLQPKTVSHLLSVLSIRLDELVKYAKIARTHPSSALAHVASCCLLALK